MAAPREKAPAALAPSPVLGLDPRMGEGGRRPDEGWLNGQGSAGDGRGPSASGGRRTIPQDGGEAQAALHRRWDRNRRSVTPPAPRILTPAHSRLPKMFGIPPPTFLSSKGVPTRRVEREGGLVPGYGGFRQPPASGPASLSPITTAREPPLRGKETRGIYTDRNKLSRAARAGGPHPAFGHFGSSPGQALLPSSGQARGREGWPKAG